MKFSQVKKFLLIMSIVTVVVLMCLNVYATVGLKLVKIWEHEQYGFANAKGEVIIQPQFAMAYEFAEGLALVDNGDKCGYIDENGKYVIEPLFYGGSSFSGGQAMVALEEYYSGNKERLSVLAYINTNGKVEQRFTDVIKKKKVTSTLRGKTAYVLAPSGLTFRDEPAPDGKKIGSVPYGQQVDIVQGDVKKRKITYDSITAGWAKVKYHGETGYVFAGYLSKIPAPELKKSDITRYFAEQMKPVGSQFELWLSASELLTITQYPLDIFTERWGRFESGMGAWSFHIPGIELDEALLFLRATEEGNKDTKVVVKSRNSAEMRVRIEEYYEGHLNYEQDVIIRKDQFGWTEICVIFDM